MMRRFNLTLIPLPKESELEGKSEEHFLLL